MTSLLISIHFIVHCCVIDRFSNKQMSYCFLTQLLCDNADAAKLFYAVGYNALEVGRAVATNVVLTVLE